MKGLVLAKYGDQAASTRQRFMQALPYLAEKGIEIEISALLDNQYLNRLFKEGTRHLPDLLRAYAARLLEIRRFNRFDFLWVQYELFPYLPGFFESLIRLAEVPVICDFDDAIFHQYDRHPHPVVRRLLGGKLKPLLTRCDMAFCGNRYLQDYIQAYCPHTELVPTTVDITSYLPAPHGASGKVTLGWMGSPSTWRYCQPLVPLLRSFISEKALSVLVVGAGGTASQPEGFTFRDWTEAGEVRDLQQMDMGIMPIPDEPWARGKCGYKLIQYMACGLPVIASPVGVNREIVEHGVNGFLASSESEWRDAISRLMADPGMRQRMGQAGREKVMRDYSIQKYGPFIAEKIAGLCRSRVTG